MYGQNRSKGSVYSSFNMRLAVVLATLIAAFVLFMSLPQVAWGDEPKVSDSTDEVTQYALAPGRLYEITLADNPLVAVDVQDASHMSGANVQLWNTNGSRSEKWYVVFDEQGYVTFECSESGLMLDVANGNHNAGANVCTATRDNTLAQKWRLQSHTDGSFSIYSALSGMALEVDCNNLVAGSNVLVNTPNESSGQRFYIYETVPLIDGYYTLGAFANDTYKLDVQDASWNSGANVQLYKNNGSAAQKWYIVRNADGTYHIESMNSGKVLAADDVAPGVNVAQQPSDQSARQAWDVYYIPGGCYAFMLKGTLNALNMHGGATSNGTNIQTSQWNGSWAQCFTARYADPLTDGDYYVGSLIDPNYKLDIQDATKASGANVQSWVYNGSRSQILRFKRQADGFYKVTFPYSGCALDVINGNVRQLKQNNSDAQRWSIHYAGGGTLRVVSKVNNLSLQLDNDVNLAGSDARVYPIADIASQKFVFEATSYIPRVSGDDELDSIIFSVLQTHPTLRSCYNYVASMRYISGSKYPTGQWSIPFAKQMYYNNGGNCYRYAALFCWLARGLGYDANVVSGHVPANGGGLAAHGWTEIHLNGTTYVCDPDMYHAIPSRNWYMVTYAQAPTWYYK